MKLSPRQIQIVELIAAGNANKQIAQALGIAEGTVKNHLKAIFSRLGCTCRAHAVAKFLQKPSKKTTLTLSKSVQSTDLSCSAR